MARRRLGEAVFKSILRSKWPRVFKLLTRPRDTSHEERNTSLGKKSRRRAHRLACQVSRRFKGHLKTHLTMETNYVDLSGGQSGARRNTQQSARNERHRCRERL